MWTKFAKSLRLLVSLLALLLPLPFATACGVYYYGEEYRVALLNPYVIGEEWSAFFYSAERLNHGRHERNGSDRQRNLAEWAAYAGNGITATDVRAVVYVASYDQLLNAIAEGPDANGLGDNPFFKALIQKEKRPVLDYLLLAKEYEHYSFFETSDPWTESWGVSEEGQSVSELGKLDVQIRMAAKFEQEKDPFLRRRYAYQLLVMSTYDQDAVRFEALYSEFFKNNRASALSDWATYHRAAIVKDAAEANYLLAMSFARCPEKRIACYHRFNKSLLNQTLAFCKNDAERALVHGLATLHHPGKALDAVQKVSKLDPKCPLLPVLLVREISKLEDWLLTDELTGLGTAFSREENDEEKWEWNQDQWATYRAANKKKDQAYLGQVRDFLVLLASQKGGALSADMANLFAGHLYLIDKQAVNAQKYLAKISQKANARIAEQQLTEQILLLLNRENIGDLAVQEKLTSLLRRLKVAHKAYEFGHRDFAVLNLLISGEYQKKGDLLTAYFFNNHSLDLPTLQRYDYGTAYYELIRFLDWQATEQDIDKVLALMAKKDKTNFEEYLTAAPLPSRNALYDLRGTTSFRKNDLNEALASFGKVDQDFWQTKYEFANFLVSDPFVMAKDSLHRGEFPATKTAFVQRLIDLEKEAKANPSSAADKYLDLATAWLNCTYRGKSWMMFCYGKSSGEVSEEWLYHSYRPRSPEMTEVYYQASRAVEYLQKARAATTDKELLARADYLLSRQRAWTYELTPGEQAELDALEWNQTSLFYLKKEMSYFEDWANAYKSTSYYGVVASECPVLVTYFGK